MNRLVIILLFLIGLGAIVHVLIRAGTGPGSHNPLEKYAVGEMSRLEFGGKGAPAPSAPIYTAEGDEVYFTAYAGRTVLVNFWATWCAPCEREMPSLGALQTARGGEAFEVVAVSVDAESDTAYAKGRMGELGAGHLDFFIVPPEQNYEFVYAAGARGFPTSILYGPDGTEIARLEGDADWASYEAIGLIDALLQ